MPQTLLAEMKPGMKTGFSASSGDIRGTGLYRF